MGVLDEVDAHLDQRNLQALASYMTRTTAQTLVVSLKDKFFGCSDGLVGVTRPPQLAASSVFTVDLSRFRTQPLVAADPDPEAPTGSKSRKRPLGSSPAVGVH